MPLQEPYGVWVAKPVRLWLDADDSPHAHVVFQDNQGVDRDVAINVQSSGKGDKRLAFWEDTDFKGGNGLVDRIKDLPLGFHRITGSQQGPGGIALDFIRGGDDDGPLVDFKAGNLLPFQIPGKDNDMVDKIYDVMNRALSEKATVYFWGERYRDGTGIHQIHMNQGNYPPFGRENGIWQDGGLMVRFADGHFHAIFLAFGVQATSSQDDGSPTEGAVTIHEIIESIPTTDEPVEQPEKLDIMAALIDPKGPDGQPGTPAEFVTISNSTTATVSLRGWYIANRQGTRSNLPETVLLGQGMTASFEVDKRCPLFNDGGSITLRDSQGRGVDHVSYTKEQLGQEGEVVKFK